MGRSNANLGTTASRAVKEKARRIVNRLVTLNRTRSGPTPTALLHRSSIRELKSYDYSIPNNQTLLSIANVVGLNTFSGGMTVINAPSTGSSFYQRVGNKIEVTSVALEADFVFSQDLANPAGGAIVRCLLVYDRAVNGSYPAIGTLFKNNDGAILFNSAINIAFRDRFAILRDEQFAMNPSNCTHHYETYVKRRMSTTFQGTAGSDNIGDIANGAIYLICFVVIPINGHNVQISTAHTRVRYLD